MDGNGMVYYDIPKTGGRIGEYYQSLQRESDQGHRTYLLDPIQVAIEYINGDGSLGQRVSADKLDIKYGATPKDFLETPVSHYIGYIREFNIENREKPYFHLDQIEWLTILDTERLGELNVDPLTLNNGYYIYNPASYPMYCQTNKDTEYKVIDPKVGNVHKTVSIDEFIAYLNKLDSGSHPYDAEIAPPFRIVTKDGYVQSITEQYIP
jgi:hypothetical protein